MHVWPHVYMYVLRMYDTYIHTYMYHMLIQAVVANLEMTEEMETDECMAVVANLEMTEEMETDYM